MYIILLILSIYADIFIISYIENYNDYTIYYSLNIYIYTLITYIIPYILIENSIH